MVQLLFAGIVTPERPMVLPPAAPPDTVPPQVLTTFGGVALKRNDGYVSVKATLVTGARLALASVNVRVEMPPARIGFGAKLFWIVGVLALGIGSELKLPEATEEKLRRNVPGAPLMP